eukprot:1187480-Prymnesium_polylepis.1
METTFRGPTVAYSDCTYGARRSHGSIHTGPIHTMGATTPASAASCGLKYMDASQAPQAAAGAFRLEFAGFLFTGATQSNGFLVSAGAADPVTVSSPG